MEKLIRGTITSCCVLATVLSCGNGSDGQSDGGGGSSEGGSTTNAGAAGSGGSGNDSTTGGSGMGSGGTLAAGGSTAESTTSSSGGTGGEPLMGTRCEPGTTNDTPYPNLIDNCYEWGDEHSGIPNLRRTSLRMIELATPTVPGEPYALSLGMEQGSTNSNIELWGAEPECGEASELLWWGGMRAGEICAEFVPSMEHSALMMVWRAMRGDTGAVHESITLCPTGSCGGAQDGLGLGIDGESLDAPIGPFLANAGISAGPLDFSPKTGYGRMHIKGSADLELGGSVAVETGYFRMHDGEPFSDAWYCSGAGSSFTWVEDEVVHFDFQNVTELARCPASNGTASATISISDVGATTIDSALEGFGASGSVSSNGCFQGATGAPCVIVFRFDDGRPDVRLHAYQVDNDGTMQGDDLVHEFRDAVLLVMPDDYGPPTAACATTGSASFAMDGSMIVTLGGLTEWLTCPGAPTEPASFVGDIEFL